MLVFKFRIQIHDDHLVVYRDLIFREDQTLHDLAVVLLEAFDYDCQYEAAFYTSHQDWRELNCLGTDFLQKKSTFSKIILKNIIDYPDQRFLFFYDPKKEFLFQIKLLSIDTFDATQNYPVCIKKYGIPPCQYSPKNLIEMSHLDPQTILKAKSSLR